MSENIVTGQDGAVEDIGPPESGFQPLRFDADAYMQYVRDFDLTEEEAHALLHEVWKIAVAFVDLAYGRDPLGLAVDSLLKNGLSPTAESANLVSSGNDHSENINDKTALRELALSVAEEES